MSSGQLPLITPDHQAAIAERDGLLHEISSFAKHRYDTEGLDESGLCYKEMGPMFLIARAVQLEPIPVDVQNLDNARYAPYDTGISIQNHERNARHAQLTKATEVAGQLQPHKLALDAIADKLYLLSGNGDADVTYELAVNYAKLFPADKERNIRLLEASARRFAKIGDAERLHDVANHPMLEPQNRRTVLNMLIALPADRRESLRSELSEQAFEEQLDYFKAETENLAIADTENLLKEFDDFVYAAIQGRTLRYTNIRQLIDTLKVRIPAHDQNILKKLSSIEQDLVTACIVLNLPSVYGDRTEIVKYIGSERALNAYVNSMLADAKQKQESVPPYKQVIDFLAGNSALLQYKDDYTSKKGFKPWTADYRPQIITDIAVAADMEAWERLASLLPKPERYYSNPFHTLQRQLFDGLLTHGHARQAITLIEPLRKYERETNELVVMAANVLIEQNDRVLLDELLAMSFVAKHTRKAVQRTLVKSQFEREDNLFSVLHDEALQPEVRIEHGIQALLKNDNDQISSDMLLAIWKDVVRAKPRSLARLADDMAQLAFVRNDLSLALAAVPHMRKPTQSELLFVAGFHSPEWSRQLAELVPKTISSAFHKTLGRYAITLTPETSTEHE